MTGGSLAFVSRQTSPDTQDRRPPSQHFYQQSQDEAPHLKTAPTTIVRDETANYSGPNRFTVTQNPQTGVWVESAPEGAFDETGTVQPDGTITFAAPAPRHERFKLGISPDGKTMKMLWYLDNTQQLTFSPDVVECKR